MVGSFIPRLTKPVFERYGFSAAAVITDWATIVGPDIARYTLPERLKWPRRIEWTGEDVADDAKGRPGATLVLAVLSGRALDIQYKSGQLIDRINAYFGYRAVATLRIVQVAELARRSDGVPPTATQIVAAPQLPGPRVELAGIAEPGLKAALERMANGLGRRQKRDLSPA